MRPRIRHILACLALAVLGSAVAAGPLPSPRSSGDDFLPPDQAFRFDALEGGSDRALLNWEIADGYYLYRTRIKVKTTSTSAQLGAPQFPPGQVKTDEYFGKQEIYHHELVVSVPVARASAGQLDLPLEVTYQGCADAGLCYPPQTKTLVVGLEGDFDYFHSNSSFANNTNTLPVLGVPFTIGQQTTTNFIATVRPRIGIAADRNFAYITGGVAFTEAHYTETYSDSNGGTGTASASKFLTG